MGVGDDAALGGLAEDLRQPDDGQLTAVEAVPQHVAAAHGRQLIRVAHQQQPGTTGEGVQ